MINEKMRRARHHRHVLALRLLKQKVMTKERQGTGRAGPDLTASSGEEWAEEARERQGEESKDGSCAREKLGVKSTKSQIQHVCIGLGIISSWNITRHHKDTANRHR